MITYSIRRALLGRGPVALETILPLQATRATSANLLLNSAISV